MIHLRRRIIPPAINVVRDGRNAITRFLRYERTFSPASRPTLLRLILGEHLYGGWSQHYEAWHTAERRRVLTLRYEELFSADEDVVRRIGQFVQYRGPVGRWENPIDQMRKRAPDVVGHGDLCWRATDEWDEVCDAAFPAVRGGLMRTGI